MSKNSVILMIILVVALGAAVFGYPKVLEFAGIKVPQFLNQPYKLGLDLQGGAQLIYEADVAGVVGISPQDAMAAVKDVVERRANLFGVSEPLVQVSRSGNSWRLIVELPGVKDVGEAIKEIGATPFLEFRTARLQEEIEALRALKDKPENIDPFFAFKPTVLNGAHLKRAQLGFDPTTGQPLVQLEFNEEGRQIFARLTRENLGKPLAIFLDGSPISIPTVQSEITSGRAVITGDFTVEEAKALAQRMNAGALPVPIKLISQHSIGASLGGESLAKTLRAAKWGLLALALFMVAVYRWRGVVALVALGVYLVYVLAIFKLVPVTLTLAGIAGLILSLGLAVDANVLIFERARHETRLKDAFASAWPAIRDGNLSTLIVALVIFTSATSFVKGFGLTLIIGILVSMFTAVFVTRLMLSFTGDKAEKFK